MGGSPLDLVSLVQRPRKLEEFSKPLPAILVLLKPPIAAPVIRLEYGQVGGRQHDEFALDCSPTSLEVVEIDLALRIRGPVHLPIQTDVELRCEVHAGVGQDSEVLVDSFDKGIASNVLELDDEVPRIRGKRLSARNHTKPELVGFREVMLSHAHEGQLVVSDVRLGSARLDNVDAQIDREQ